MISFRVIRIGIKISVNYRCVESLVLYNKTCPFIFIDELYRVAEMFFKEMVDD